MPGVLLPPDTHRPASAPLPTPPPPPPTPHHPFVTDGVVAGMMTSISITELLPNARNYDPSDVVTTRFLVVGFVLMAATLVLLAYVGAPE